MLGTIASQYYLSYMTVSMFGSNIGPDTSLEVRLTVVSCLSDIIVWIIISFRVKYWDFLKLHITPVSSTFTATSHIGVHGHGVMFFKQLRGVNVMYKQCQCNVFQTIKKDLHRDKKCRNILWSDKNTRKGLNCGVIMFLNPFWKKTSFWYKLKRDSS